MLDLIPIAFQVLELPKYRSWNYFQSRTGPWIDHERTPELTLIPYWSWDWSWPFTDPAPCSYWYWNWSQVHTSPWNDFKIQFRPYNSIWYSALLNSIPKIVHACVSVMELSSPAVFICCCCCLCGSRCIIVDLDDLGRSSYGSSF